MFNFFWGYLKECLARRFPWCRTLKRTIKKVFGIVQNNAAGYDPVTEELRDFISLNTPQWADIAGEARNGCVLVEGLLANYGPNYMLRTGMIAKAIEEKTGAIPLVYMDSPGSGAEKGYSSFNISNFIYPAHDVLSVWHRLISVLYSLHFRISANTPQSLLALRWKGMLIGDLIYDEILHEINSLYTISKIEPRFYRYICKAFWLCMEYSRIFSRFDIKYMVSTHTMYSTYGLLPRLSAMHGKVVFETTDMELIKYKTPMSSPERALPYYLCGIQNRLADDIVKYENMPDNKIMELSEAILQKRLEGKFEAFDVMLAYGNKKTYSREALLDMLDLSRRQAPNIFIFSHVFTDAPHLSGEMLFPDYYVWLRATLEKAASLPQINWIVKAHPSAGLYHGDIALQKQLKLDFSGTSIRILPDDVNTRTALSVADGIVTCQGTVGLEAACLGIPVLTAGKGFYAGFGLAREPKTLAEYFALMESAAFLESLNKSQVLTARKILLASYAMWDTMTELIPARALHYIWGYNSEGRDLAQGYRLLLEHLATRPLRETAFFKKVQGLLQ